MTDNGNTAPGNAQLSPVATMNDFAKFITEAAAAMQKVPELERNYAEANRQFDDALRHTQELELTIRQLRDDANINAEKLREVSTERDTFRDEARNLFADRTRLVSSIETAMDMVRDDIRQVVTQPHAGPAPQAPSPASEPSSQTFTGFEPAAAPPTTPYPEPTPAPVEPDPSQKYAGLIYANIPGYVSFHDWLDGGGSEEGYTARQTQF